MTCLGFWTPERLAVLPCSSHAPPYDHGASHRLAIVCAKRQDPAARLPDIPAFPPVCVLSLLHFDYAPPTRMLLTGICTTVDVALAPILPPHVFRAPGLLPHRYLRPRLMISVVPILLSAHI